MATTKLYKQSIRGQIVDLTKDTSVKASIWDTDKLVATTTTFDGPLRLGQATGNLTQNSKGETDVIEVLAAGLPGISGYQFGLGYSPIALIWVPMGSVLLTDNADYDPTKDKDRIGGALPTDAPVERPTTTSTAPVVGETSEQGTIPVKNADGKTVFVNLDKLEELLNKQRQANTPQVYDATKKYLTWALYGLIGLTLITLTIVIAKQVTKPKLATK